MTRKLAHLIAWFAATIVLAAVVAAQPAATPDPAIVKVADAYTAATLAADVKAITALYTDDAIEMPPNEPPVKGRAAIEAYYVKQFAMGKITAFTLTHLDTRSSGDIGYDVGTYTQTISGEKPMNSSGKYTVTLRRVGGAWKVSSAIYNTDRPMMPSPPAQKP
jgi:ketosteroid isomerase-like protein